MKGFNEIMGKEYCAWASRRLWEEDGATITTSLETTTCEATVVIEINTTTAFV